MEISADIVREQRQQRGWTQQHLADAAGCSLRTVQRIEKHGVASNESVSALCAVFELDRAALIPESSVSGQGASGVRRTSVMIVASAAAGAGVGAMLTWLLMSASGAA